HVPRPHARRPPTNRANGPRKQQRELSFGGTTLQHAERGLQAVPELPPQARLPFAVPAFPCRARSPLLVDRFHAQGGRSRRQAVAGRTAICRCRKPQTIPHACRSVLSTTTDPRPVGAS